MIYFIIYAVPSWLLIMFGMMNQYAWYTLGGFGILLWFSLFFVHDLIIHQRFKVFTKTKNVFVLALRAHKMHHKILERRWRKFGMLIIKKYIQAALK
jgi:beta-carotene 3-hydroxylase